MVLAQQWECTKAAELYTFKLLKMVNFMLCTFLIKIYIEKFFLET